MPSYHSVPSRRTHAALPLLPLPLRALLPLLPILLVAVVLLSGCTGGAPMQTGQTPVSSPTIQSQPQAPNPVGTAPPGPPFTAEPTLAPPAAVATAKAIELASHGPTPIPTVPKPTIDPSIPTSTPLPTPTPFPPAPPLTNAVPDPHQQGVQYFPQTGHTLRGVFLDYWNKHGGVEQFGYPITEEFVEPQDQGDTMLQVQYFEKVRFEHHPEQAGTQNEVQLSVSGGLPGKELAQQKGYFAGRYPLYGHAADYSWVAGQIEFHAPTTDLSASGGCSILSYREDRKKIELEGVAWHTYGDRNSVLKGTFIVVHGRFAREDEHYNGCPTSITRYVVSRFYVHPAP